MASTPEWHPKPDAVYFNTQGINHLHGTNGKKPSTSDAERCFRKSYEMGDNSAAFNLALMIAQGLISGNKDDVECLINPLIEIGLLEDSDRYELFGIGPDIKVIETVSESKIKEWVGKKGKLSNIDSLIIRSDPSIIEKGFYVDLRSKLETKLKKIIIQHRLATLDGHEMAGKLLSIARQELPYGVYSDLRQFCEFVGQNASHDIKGDLNNIPRYKVERWQELIDSL